MSDGVRILDEFAGGELNPYWTPWTIGTGILGQAGGRLRLSLSPGTARRYSDAQIADYPREGPRDFRWQAPLRLTIRAWASHSANELKGTAGFGFWNEPFVPVGTRLPRLPRTAWFFFGSPPNNIALADGVPGHGWKAATLDATRLPFLLLAPFAPIGFGLMRIPALYRALWPLGQWAVGASEALLPVDLAEPHTYTLEWLPDAVMFAVDDKHIHQAPCAPRGSLGFIAWIDNQYAVVTPQGRFQFGVMPVEQPQTLTLDAVMIESL